MGRTKEFDRELVLHKAMLVFWEKGYESASIPDLIQTMGISRSSLYESFTDKKNLYLEAIGHYKKVRRNKRELLLGASPVKEGIRQFFSSHIEAAYDKDFPGGCLITNEAVRAGTADAAIIQVVQESLEDLEELFYKVLKKGQRSGEIDQTTDLRVAAYLLLNLNHSINLLSKVKKEKRLVYAMVDKIIGSL
ncbi:TetR/AcrR family transcriptional regulator [Domibacillus sp. PGB-M46]|uniref:TetR/AcrR family transcriptional regulator n=1 Tax=Domibacillus sp. PGB-M46 TaxID=2910255 RepID=UPI001F5A22B1|nr:TetR/AcrR family transcriptional regulator [Domibacillus sp. PGB-M46]MCI2256424.1 TetR/AcrR family transcriptional regulator [Domibacillus sp. PGB-M46]